MQNAAWVLTRALILPVSAATMASWALTTSNGGIGEYKSHLAPPAVLKSMATTLDLSLPPPLSVSTHLVRIEAFPVLA